MRCELKLSRLNAQAGVSSAQVTCTVTRQLGGDGLELTARQAGVGSHGRGPKDTQQSREITDGQLYFASFFGRCISVRNGSPIPKFYHPLEQVMAAIDL